MASVSVSSLIMFIAAVSVAATVAGTLAITVTEISDSIDDRSVEVSESIDTDVEVISDAGSDAIYNGTDDTVTLYVKNTGSGTLPNSTDALDVLVDGEYVSGGSLSMDVLEGDNWREGTVAELTIQESLGAGSHRVQIVVNKEEEVFEFYV